MARSPSMTQRKSQCLLLARAGVSGQESRGGPQGYLEGLGGFIPRDNYQMHFCVLLSSAKILEPGNRRAK